MNIYHLACELFYIASYQPIHALFEHVDFAKVKQAAREVMIAHARVGFDFPFNAKDDEFIKRRQKLRPRKEIEEPGDEPLNPPTKRSKTDGSNDASQGKTIKKDVRFTWTQNRKSALVDCVMDSTFFTGLPKDHDNIAKKLLQELINDGFDSFKRTDYKAIKHKLYDLQHIMINVHPIKEAEMKVHPYHIQKLYKYFVMNEISLDEKLYVNDLDGM